MSGLFYYSFMPRIQWLYDLLCSVYFLSEHPNKIVLYINCLNSVIKTLKVLTGLQSGLQLYICLWLNEYMIIKCSIYCMKFHFLFFNKKLSTLFVCSLYAFVCLFI